MEVKDLTNWDLRLMDTAVGVGTELNQRIDQFISIPSYGCLRLGYWPAIASSCSPLQREVWSGSSHSHNSNVIQRLHLVF